MKRLEVYDRIFWGLVILAVILSIIGIFYEVHAQDEPVTVCRDTSYGTVRIIVQGFTGDMQYFAEGVSMEAHEDGSYTLIADGLTQKTIEHYDYASLGFYAGEVYVYKGNFETVVIGDENSAPCDAQGYPSTTLSKAPAKTHSDPPSAMVSASTGRTCVVKYPQIILVCS